MGTREGFDSRLSGVPPEVDTRNTAATTTRERLSLHRMTREVLHGQNRKRGAGSDILWHTGCDSPVCVLGTAPRHYPTPNSGEDSYKDRGVTPRWLYSAR